MEVDKKRLDKLGITSEKLMNKLNKDFDLSLYDLNENQDEIIFVIKESVVLEQLQNFTQYQYSMYPQEQWDTDCFESASEMIGELSSLKELVELAEEGRFPCFQSNKIVDEIKVSAWESLEMKIFMLVFFVEGKIFMEGYNSFLKFIENNVRESSKGWSIAGAFKCFID
ncbi:hypothetical protein ACE38V_22555 [Cytobacillus sp. Hz8]|uniref:hypothetical protein n=1 Tax=Cytobacillus sp. Hz8 TaxID=3347168 RepID=UPI0035DF26C0